ncbi:MAG: hypothetical protein Hals2KO_35960 [Halioglobus sp.]
MPFRLLYKIPLVMGLALLGACASQTPTADEEPVSPQVDVQPEVKHPERPFPEDSLYDLLVAEFALRRREYNTALETYLALTPELNDPGISSHATHLSQFMERDEDTLAAAQLWVSQEPDNIEARAIVAQQLVRGGNNLEAMQHLAAIERAGGSANFAIVSRNFNQLSPRDRSKIVIELNTLNAEFPNNGSLLLTQALLHNELGQNDLALSKLAQLFELEPDQHQALLLEAKILAETGAKDPYKRVEKALKENPEDRALRLRYARLLAATDMVAARGQFEILSAGAPRDGDLLFSLALINREVGDPTAASAYLRQLLLLEQREDEAHYYLGRIEEDREHFEDALLHYQNVGSGEE